MPFTLYTYTNGPTLPLLPHASSAERQLYVLPATFHNSPIRPQLVPQFQQHPEHAAKYIKHPSHLAAYLLSPGIVAGHDCVVLMDEVATIDHARQLASIDKFMRIGEESSGKLLSVVVADGVVGNVLKEYAEKVVAI
jgi:hypothetical protein